MLLSKKVAVITGCNKGIGKKILENSTIEIIPASNLDDAAKKIVKLV